MHNDDKESKSDRRKFLGSLASGAAVLGMAVMAVPIPLSAAAEVPPQERDPDAWFDKIKGKHKMVFDVTQPHDILPFAWPRVFLTSNGMTGTAEKDCGVVVVLRHAAIGYAFEDRIWEKYKFGELFKATDPATKMTSTRNPFASPKPDEYKVPGVGAIAIGINELQASGVLFCVCNMAITKTISVLGTTLNADPAEIRKDLLSGLLSGIQLVPSGVWALGRAQERGCGYCFTG